MTDDQDTGAGPLALVGSGEYLEHMLHLEANLIARRPPRYVQIATAAVPDGESVVARWHELGRVQARRLGVEAVVLDIADRDDAEDPEIAARVAGAGLIYLSGGHPDYLAETLRDTATWRAIVSTWRSGAALAGCSAGAMVMARWIPSWRHPDRSDVAGLGLLPHLRVIPHFDRFASFRPDIASLRRNDEDDVTVVGVDEETALVGGPRIFEVWGRGAAWVIERDGRRRVGPGELLEL